MVTYARAEQVSERGVLLVWSRDGCIYVWHGQVSIRTVSSPILTNPNVC